MKNDRDAACEGDHRNFAPTPLCELGSPCSQPCRSATVHHDGCRLAQTYQFDWGHKVVLINGATTTVKVAHVRLSYSRMPFVRAYPRETQAMVCDAHDKAFAFFGGGCARGIY